MGLYAPDAIREATGLGTTFEGKAAIRDFIDGWVAGYDEYVAQIVNA